MNQPQHAQITEVGPRDGFQAERSFIPTAQKIEFIDRLVDAGVPRIEATSFVSPRAVPQLADAEEGMRSKAVSEPPLMLAISAWCAIRDAVAAAGDYGSFPELHAPATPEAILRAVDGVRGSMS